jgi:hypothetical protein
MTIRDHLRQRLTRLSFIVGARGRYGGRPCPLAPYALAPCTVHISRARWDDHRRWDALRTVSQMRSSDGCDRQSGSERKANSR